MSALLPKMSKARTHLVLTQPFFASLLLPMPISDDPSIPTMATDGESIRYNSTWTESLTLQEVIFVLAHEVMHCVLDHMGRRGTRDHARWNQAADYAINQVLVDDEVGSMPEVGLLDRDLYKRGEGTAEGIYRLLPEEKEGKGHSEKACGSGKPGASLDEIFDAGSEMGAKPVDAATAAQKSAEIKVRVIQAKNAAKMQGKLSKSLARLIDETLKPQVNWREVLRRFVSERAKVDPSFARPKRRFIAEDLYLPSLSGQCMGKLAIAIDCSGSVDKKLLSEFAAEINAIRADVHPREVELVYFDSRVCHAETVDADGEIEIKPRGGGGTNFAPVFEHINHGAEMPTAVVFLTDLMCHDFGPRPDYPVLWCVLGSVTRGFDKVPFGEILEVTHNEK